MKTPICIIAASLFSAGAFAWNYGAKNVIEARFMDVPESCEEMLKTDPGDWNFSFRPYGSDSNMLWTDPVTARSAISGGMDFAGKHPTALNVTCNADGWTFLVLCVAPEIDNALSMTNSLPVPSVEFFFVPGDTDTHLTDSHYHFFWSESSFNHYPWSVQDRTWRNILSSIRSDCRRLPNGYLLRFTIPWEVLFDKLPFAGPDKADNFWRLQVIRWVDGGVTFGGTVHQQSRAGYVKFPDFTDGQKEEMMLRILEKAWIKFNTEKNSRLFNVSGGWASPSPRTEKYIVDHVAQFPRTYLNYGEDPEFNPVLKRLVEERLALGPEIASFRKKSPAEQLCFYRKASDMLFNFRYDVEESYRAFLCDKFLK